MGSLFAEVAKTHEVSSEAVSNSLGRNRGWIDLAMILPLVLLYGAVAAAVARVVWRRYPPREDGWIPGAVMILFLSLAVAAGSIMLGELWCWNVETLRVGNGHMSFRIQRLWWVRHQAGMFAGGVIAFWTVSVWSASPRSIRRTSTGSGSPWPGGSGRALRG